MQGWPRVAAALRPDHELVAVPLHGADGPTSALPLEWGILAQARRIAAQVRPADILVGHSMGGTIAIRVAQLARPRMLVLVEPHVVPRAGFVVRPTLELGLTPDAEARAGFLRRMAPIQTGEGTYAEWIAKWDWRVFHAMSQELATGDGGKESWMETLEGLGGPRHLLWGALSADHGEDHHKAALARLGIKPEMVPGSAHFIPSEAPAGLATALRDLAAS